MKQTKIIKDKRQTRTTIPSKIVEEAKIESNYKANWNIDYQRKVVIAEIQTPKLKGNEVKFQKEGGE